MKTNVATRVPVPRTHEGAIAHRINAEQELRRSAMCCLLWEDSFYESGESIADRIAGGVTSVAADTASKIAIEARTKNHLRHVPLWIAVQMIEQKYKDKEDRNIIGRTIAKICRRPDEMGELISLYWKGGKKPITRQMKIGLAQAFKKFDEYSLAKYDRDGAVKLRDVMFLCHPKPDNEDQEALFKKVASRTLQTPDTWEVALSGGGEKKQVFERLMAEGKLGGLAFVRNLRNMATAGISKTDVAAYAYSVNLEKVLPFRFISAANAVPEWADLAESMMLRSLAEIPKLAGKTAIVVDNSGSMYGCKVSKKSDIDRSDAACALAILIREICEDAVVIGYGEEAAMIPTNYRGFVLRDAIKCGPGGGTDTGIAIQEAKRHGYERIIVITDEQSHTQVPDPETPRAYFINVDQYKNGIGYGKWVHIDGWSENVLEYIRAYEASAD